MTLDAVIRRLENRAAAARHMANAHDLDGNDTAAAEYDAAAEWFDQQITDLTATSF